MSPASQLEGDQAVARDRPQDHFLLQRGKGQRQVHPGHGEMLPLSVSGRSCEDKGLYSESAANGAADTQRLTVLQYQREDLFAYGQGNDGGMMQKQSKV